MRKVQGIIPIVQAPFTADGSDVHYEDFARLCDATIKDGSAAICLFGYGTEFWKLSDAEKEEMVKVAVKTTAGRVPVIASITLGSTELAVKAARRYEELGIDAVMVLSPSVIVPSTNQLAEHIITVGNSVSLPSMVQYAPQCGGGLLTLDALKRVCGEIKNEFYIKAEATPISTFVDQLKASLGEAIHIWAGNMALYMIELMDRGVRGFLPDASMVPIYRTIFNAYLAGDKKKAQQIYDAMVPMIVIINQNAEILVKYSKMMLVKRGIISNSCCRQPTAIAVDERFWELFQEYRERLRDIADIGEDYTV